MTGMPPIHDHAKILELSGRGWPASRVADTVGCSKRTVQRVREKHGLSAPVPPRITDEEWALAEQLLADGCSISEVERTTGRSMHKHFRGRGMSFKQASELGVAARRINRRARKLGLPVHRLDG